MIGTLLTQSVKSPTLVVATTVAMATALAGVVPEPASFLPFGIEGKQDLDALIVVLGAGGAIAREHAALALGLIEHESAVEALLQAVEDEDAGVRKQALWALMQCIDDVDDAEVDYEELAATLRRVLRSGGSQ